MAAIVEQGHRAPPHAGHARVTVTAHLTQATASSRHSAKVTGRALLK